MAWGAGAKEQNEMTSPTPVSVLPNQAPLFPNHAFLPVGTKVEFKTVLGGVVSGHVVIFDQTLKVLVIKDLTNASKPVMRVFNLALIDQLKELSAATAESTAECIGGSNQGSSTPLSMERRQASMEKRLAEAMHQDVSLDGQRAFVNIRRTLEDVQWKGADIKVLDRVVVKHPYNHDAVFQTQDDAQGKAALSHVQKILSKPFQADASLEPCCKAT